MREAYGATRRRTDRRIREEFTKLLRDKTVEHITVSELCRAADINKATFYRYYSDLYALKASLEDELFNLLFTDIARRGYAPAENGRTTVKGFVLEALNTVEKHIDLCRIFISDTKGGFISRLEEALLDVFYQSDSRQYMNRECAQLMFSYMAGGVISLLRSWINGGCQTDLNMTAELIDSNLMSAYKYLNRFKQSPHSCSDSSEFSVNRKQSHS